MKTNLLRTGLLAMALLTVPAVVQAQFTYTTNGDNTIAITGYTGPGGAVIIPDTISGLPVTSIGGYYDSSSNWIGAFENCYQLTSVTIPGSVTSIGDGAFESCYSLNSVTIPDSVASIGVYAFGGDTGYYNPIYFPLPGPPGLTNATIGNGVVIIGNRAFYGCFDLVAISVAPQNPSYSSVNGVLFNKSHATLIQYPAGKIGSAYRIPNGVNSIGDSAFYNCAGLTSVTMPASVTNIEASAFSYCTSLKSVTLGNNVASIGDDAFVRTALNSLVIPASITNIGNFAFVGTPLTGIYLLGNAFAVSLSVFDPDYPPTIYYLPESTGWDSVGYPAVLWNPQIRTNDSSFGLLGNRFGFNIVWTNGQAIVVEACANLSNPVWVPVATNTFTSNSFYFSDPEWTNYPSRSYRITAFTPQLVLYGDYIDLDICRSVTIDSTTRIKGANAYMHDFIQANQFGGWLTADVTEALGIAQDLDPADPTTIGNARLLEEIEARSQGR